MRQSKLKARMIRPDDVDIVNKSFEKKGAAKQIITENTILVVDEEENVLAIGVVAMVPWVYIHWDEDLTGHKAGLKLLRKLKNGLTTSRAPFFFFGVDDNAHKAKALVEKLGGYNFQNERVYCMTLNGDLEEEDYGLDSRNREV